MAVLVIVLSTPVVVAVPVPGPAKTIETGILGINKRIGSPADLDIEESDTLKEPLKILVEAIYF